MVGCVVTYVGSADGDPGVWKLEGGRAGIDCVATIESSDCRSRLDICHVAFVSRVWAVEFNFVVLALVSSAC